MKSQKFVSHLVRKISWNDIDEKYVQHLIKTARAEDIEGAGLKVAPKIAADITTMTLTPDAQISVALSSRKDIVVCGLKLVPIILDVYKSFSDVGDCVFVPTANDGDKLPAGAKLGEIKGSARIILQAERIMLNFLQRLSGVATETAKYVAALGNSPTRLLDTRKTTPMLRVLEKYAFACGGGFNHRMGLFDRVMLKDNHLVAAHAVSGEHLAEAVRIAKEKNPDVAIEVEVDKISQIQPVLDAKADVIMLDNFSLSDLKKALAIIDGNAWTEVSGGVTLKILAAIGELAPDFVSSAAPVHSSCWIDIGLDEVK